MSTREPTDEWKTSSSPADNSERREMIARLDRIIALLEALEERLNREPSNG